MLARIYFDSNGGYVFEADRVMSSYIDSLLNILGNSHVLNKKDIDILVCSLKKNFRIGVFKDSKPTNWIIDKDGLIYLLDFDYVKLSFFLSDLAQMTSYLSLHCNISLTSYLRKFLSLVDLDKEFMTYIPLFYLAMIYSNYKKMNYIRDKVLLKRIIKKNNFFIFELKKLCNR